MGISKATHMKHIEFDRAQGESWHEKRIRKMEMWQLSTNSRAKGKDSKEELLWKVLYHVYKKARMETHPWEVHDT